MLIPESIESFAPATRLDDVLARQRTAFRRHPFPLPRVRQEHLRRLEHLLLSHEQAICESISTDFGHRSEVETRMLELFPSLNSLRHARRHVARWMQPERRRSGIWFKPGRAEIRYQPLGVVGIIVPWNYPLYLAIGPVASALAAGNRVMLKLSEFTPTFGGLFARLIRDNFSDDHIFVCTGDAQVGRAFSALPFDHLLFTGSTAVGRDVMATAARHLTPVTLELGGKSPALIAPDYEIAIAARRIMFGKLVNAGQTCIAPDYVLAPTEKIEELVAALRSAAVKFFKSTDSADYTSIVNDRHFARLEAIIADARTHGARIEVLLPAGSSSSRPRRFAPVALIGGHRSMRAHQEEIFGPILPIVGYRTRDEAIAYINDGPKPLALYVFDANKTRADELLATTASGGVTLNDTLLHVGQEDLPFGGVGDSGMGRYHGIDGFRTFSQTRSVFRQSRVASTSLMYPPYGRLTMRLLALMLGRRR